MMLQFLPVDWPAASALCMAFRRDAWAISYGKTDDFSESDTLAWFECLAKKYPNGFLHVWHAGNIIGQIEYRAPIVWENDGIGGYINLFYLQSSHRRKGLGRLMHDFVMQGLLTQGCSLARLRVIDGNCAAEQFYAALGWQKLGEVDAKGAQVLTQSLR